MRLSSILGGVALALASSTTFASITVTNYQLPDGAAFGSVTSLGYSYYTGPIVLQTTVGDLTVYCADLQHEIYGGTTYRYAYAPLTYNGAGDPLSQPLSNELGQIAGIGKAALAHGDDIMASAAQAAVWGLEYGTTPSFANAAIEADYASLIGRSYFNNGRWGEALVPIGWPNPQAAQQLVIGVPEPSMWLMMAVGFAALGAAGRFGRPSATARIGGSFS